MTTDQQGNALTGATTQAADHFNEALVAFNTYCGDPIGAIDTAIAMAPDFVMAYVLKAHIFSLATEAELKIQARDIVLKLKPMRMDDREASHLHSLELVLDGQWTAAAQALDMHNCRYPLDILGLQSGHLIDFYRGNARNLRDRISRVLPMWSTDSPGYGIVLGMHAFGLEESGDYACAEDQGLRAIELQPLDSWAHHAVAHVLQMQGRIQDGINWMNTRQAYWARDDNFFKVHNWWHNALYLLDSGQEKEALALYDNQIRKTRTAIALELVDASAMLWRLSLKNIDVGNRWTELADCWETQADGQTYPFNDWHAVMAYLGAGRDNRLQSVLESLQKTSTHGTETAQWIRQTAIPLIHGFSAFWRQDYAQAVQQLHGARFIANSFGGSHAQRDIIDLTLLEAARRGGFPDLAKALSNERASLYSTYAKKQ